MKRTLRIFLPSVLFIIIGIIVYAAAYAQTGGDTAPILMAYLSGSKEAPKADTTARGRITFHLSDDSEKLYYKLNVSHVRNVTGADIRLGSMEETGRVVVILFDTESPWASNINNVALEGIITGDNLIGPLYGQSLDALLREIENNYAYVTIRSSKNTGGHIRGQIVDPSRY